MRDWPPSVPKKSPIMFGAALSGPLAAPAPDCAKRSAGDMSAGEGAAACGPPSVAAVPAEEVPSWAKEADGAVKTSPKNTASANSAIARADRIDMLPPLRRKKTSQ